jgi:hypothetical protein
LPTRLVLLSPEGGTLDAVPLDPSRFPGGIAAFRASPDGERIAVIEPGSIAVQVIDLASGEVEAASPHRPHWTSTTLPAWKSATELTFAGLPEGSEDPTWMLWTQEAGRRAISARWAPQATSGWLEHKEPEDPESGSP